jgi:hypothetical protein
MPLEAGELNGEVLLGAHCEAADSSKSARPRKAETRNRGVTKPCRNSSWGGGGVRGGGEDAMEDGVELGTQVHLLPCCVRSCHIILHSLAHAVSSILGISLPALYSNGRQGKQRRRRKRRFRGSAPL